MKKRIASKMNIAIMGIRGIPANYGGFETFAEELSTRLVEKGHKVTVYGRSNIIDYKGSYYKKVRIIKLPTISHKYLDTVFHTFLCTCHSLFKAYDIVLFCNVANSIFSWIPRISGKKVVINVDGIERKRKKWNLLGKLWYLSGEIFSVIFPHKIVSDARVIQAYYLRRYRKNSVFIPYGAYTKKATSQDSLEKFSIQTNEYILYVSRLEPENNAHLVIKAFEQVDTQKKLVIVGDAPYAQKYIYYLKKTKDPRIVFTGYVFGRGYKELQSHAYCYVHATEVGGTHPALIEAMGFGNCVIVNGTEENREVVGDAGLIYRQNDVDDLRDKIQYVIDHEKRIANFRQRARRRVENNYSWDSISEKYSDLFKKLLTKQE